MLKALPISLLRIALLLVILLSNAAATLAEDTNPPSSTKPNANVAGDHYWVIYDNVCPYCQETTKYIKQLDWEGKFKLISYRDPNTYIMFPFLSKEECEKDVHMVTPEGKVLVGYKVFRTIIDNLTATKLLNPLLQNNFAEEKLNELYEKIVFKRSCYYEKTPSCGADGKDTHDAKKEAVEEPSSPH